MNLTCDPSRALLIDDKKSNLDAWAGRGGIGYLYTTDSTFRRDVAGGIDHLVGSQSSMGALAVQRAAEACRTRASAERKADADTDRS